MGLISKMIEDRRTEQSDAIEEYRAILAREADGESTQQDAAAMPRLMSVLGKSEDDVRQDLAIFQKLSEMRSRFASHKGSSALSERLGKELEPFREETNRKIAELRAELSKRQQEHEAAANSYVMGQNLVSEINNFIRRNPILVDQKPAALSHLN